MTEYVFVTEEVTTGEMVDVPDNARDVNIEHGENVCRISYLEKQGDSVL